MTDEDRRRSGPYRQPFMHDEHRHDWDYAGQELIGGVEFTINVCRGLVREGSSTHVCGQRKAVRVR